MSDRKTPASAEKKGFVKRLKRDIDGNRVPTFDNSLCSCHMYLQDGSCLPDSGLFVHIKSGFWSFPNIGATPVGEWSIASSLVLDKNDRMPVNAGYEIVEDQKS